MLLSHPVWLLLSLPATATVSITGSSPIASASATITVPSSIESVPIFPVAVNVTSDITPPPSIIIIYAHIIHIIYIIHIIHIIEITCTHVAIIIIIIIVMYIRIHSRITFIITAAIIDIAGGGVAVRGPSHAAKARDHIHATAVGHRRR